MSRKEREVSTSFALTQSGPSTGTLGLWGRKMGPEG